MQCKICGDTAKDRNYGVITCMACKVFFQRHKVNNIDASRTLKCYSPDDPCQVNLYTRKHCIYCRLTACLRVGMRVNLRNREKGSRHRQELKDEYQLFVEQKYKHAQLVTLDLLRADRSSLNVTQWKLISNIIQTYDTLFEEQKQKLLRFHIHNEQKPIKLRLKLSNYQQLVATYFTFIIPFLEHIPD